MPAPIPHGCPPSAVIAASPTLIKMAAVSVLLVGGVSLLMSAKFAPSPAPSAAGLPDNCGALMVALVQSGARHIANPLDVQTEAKKAGQTIKKEVYYYIPDVQKLRLTYQVRESTGGLNLNEDIWSGDINCKKSIPEQIKALNWPAPIPGVTPPNIEAKK